MALPDIRVCQTSHGGHPQVREFTAGAAITANSFVTWADDGEIDEIGDAGATILGLALNAAAAQGDKVLVAIAEPGTVFSAKVKTGTWAAEMIGEQQQLDHDGVDLGTAGTAITLGLDETDDTAAGTRRVLITFEHTALAYHIGTAT